METRNRIALTGSYGNGKTLVSLVVSDMFGVPRAHVESIDVLYKDIYGVDKNPQFYTQPELFSVGLARFHSRIRQEKQTGFVSDGSVLNELAYGEARIRLSSKKKQGFSLNTTLYGDMYKDFGSRLERTIIDYARTAYDCVYYLKVSPISSTRSETNQLFQDYYEEALFKLFEKGGIKYQCLVGKVDSFVMDIWGDCNSKMLKDFEVSALLDKAETMKRSFVEDFHFGK